MNDLARGPGGWHRALAAWGIDHAHAEPVLSGNINRTWIVEVDGRRRVLQRVNPIFRPEVHLDILAVGAHLRERGLACPELMPTLAGTLWAQDDQGGIWRLLTFVPGQVWARAPEAATCRAAGLLLGRFHAALMDYTQPMNAARLGVHDTAAHLAGLEAAVEQRFSHPAHPLVRPLAAQILAQARALPPLHGGPPRMVHGDPKLANIVFASPTEARALIDLDTLGRMPLVLELGDALRSWCATEEDARVASFSLPYFAAAWEGWRAAAPVDAAAEELQALPWALPTIALELAARFARDALEERYFSWDAGRYQAAWEHHLARARNQLALATHYLGELPAIRDLLASPARAPREGVDSGVKS